MNTIIGIVLALGVIILVHEWGHFIAARFFGVRVDVFSIGFGPRLFGVKRGDTDWRGQRFSTRRLRPHRPDKTSRKLIRARPSPPAHPTN